MSQYQSFFYKCVWNYFTFLRNCKKSKKLIKKWTESAEIGLTNHRLDAIKKLLVFLFKVKNITIIAVSV